MIKSERKQTSTILRRVKRSFRLEANNGKVAKTEASLITMFRGIKMGY